MNYIYIKQRLFYFLVVLTLVYNDINAQAAFEPRRSTFCLGIGQVSYLNSVFDNPPEWGDSYLKKRYGAFIFKYEYALTRNIGIGFGIGYAVAKGHMVYTPPYGSGGSFASGDYKFSNLGLAPRINFHLGRNLKIDPYLGFSADIHREAYRMANSDESFLNLTDYKLNYEAVVGIKMLLGNYFKNFGVFVEFGKSNNGFLQYGLIIRI